MRRIWFQFRKEPESTGKAVVETPEPEKQPAQEGERAAAEERAEREEQLSLRLSGSLWVVPEGPYMAVVLEGLLKDWNAATGPRLEEAALHLGGGEMRRLSVRLTRTADERTETGGFDLPLVAQVRSRTALASLRLGDLTLPESFASPGSGEIADEAYAEGTAIFRCARVSGTFYDEPFRVRLIELDQVHLVQGQQAWVGRLFQSVAERVPKGSSRALYQYLRRAASAADLLPRLRQATERLQQTQAAGSGGPSAEERNHKARQEVQDGQDDEHDG